MAITATEAGGSHAGAVLTIDLAALVANYGLVRDRAAPAVCAAVVKADGYGLGVGPVASALYRAGCRNFFVAHPEEGVTLRALLPDAAIYVLNGFFPDAIDLYGKHRLDPVLNDSAQVGAWAAAAAEGRVPADRIVVHFDSGMNRLGLDADETARLADDPALLAGFADRLYLSHLACADTPAHPLNAGQLTAFRAATARLPPGRRCLANSSGIFLGPDYRFDMVRPGIALYGGNPVPGEPNPMHSVVRLSGRILQVRSIDRPGTVGYGATHRVSAGVRIATVAVGYADGYLRSLSNAARGRIASHVVPLIGRVSMDLTTFDVTGVPDSLCRPGMLVDLIGPDNPVDSVAEDAGTISYEILTSLGARYRRVHIGGEL